MKAYQVMVKTRQKEDKVTLSADQPDTLFVSTKALPVDGGANASVINILSEYFQVPKSSVTIVRGFKSKRKSVIVQ